MSRRPAGVITAAPGHGLVPRTRLARARAGSSRRSQPSSFLRRGASVARRPSCGTGTSEPESSSSSVRSRTRAPISASRAASSPAVSSGPIGVASEQHVARVHARVHLKRRDAALRLSADDRPGDGPRPAIAREERGVNVDRPARGRVEHRLRQDLAERRDHRDVGGERGQARRPLGIAQPRRLEHGTPASSARRLTADAARRCPRPAGRSG